MTATELLALTLRAEAGERPVRAIEALAALVVNRARLAAEGAASRARFAPGGTAGMGWAKLLAPVCRAPFLFGCWNARHPRRAVLLAVAQAQGQLRASPSGGALPAPLPDPMFDICCRIACRAAGGSLPDPTEGATHWHDAADLPGWAISHMPTAEIGGLVFYRLGG